MGWVDVPEVSRRGALVGAATALALSSCGGGDGAGTRRSGPTRRFQDVFGPVEVPQHPTRIVAIGSGDMEAVIATGLVPLAGTEVLGSSGRLRPWVRSAIDGPEVPVLLDWQALEFETIAALRPDLILYVNSPGDEATYDLLRQIAPTVGPPPGTQGAFEMPWRDQLDLVGQVVGRPSEAAHARAGVDGLLATVRRDHPEFSGLTVTVGVARPGQVYLLPTGDPRVQLLAELGFEPGPQQAGDGEDDYLVPVSPERYDILEADVVVVCALEADGEVAESLLAGGTFERLAAAREGRVVLLPGPSVYTSRSADGDYASALAVGGPLGIPAALERLTSDLALATSG